LLTANGYFAVERTGFECDVWRQIHKFQCFARLNAENESIELFLPKRNLLVLPPMCRRFSADVAARLLFARVGLLRQHVAVRRPKKVSAGNRRGGIRPSIPERREVQAARRRALVFRATGRRTARFTDLRRAAPERLVAVRFIFALRAGFAFFFAIFAIVFLSFSFPSFQFCP
jgi:hypothetical protein